MPLSKARERLMLRALNRYGTGPDGCTQAWLSLPHSTRVFYPHAYCSRSATNAQHNTVLQDFLSSLDIFRICWAWSKHTFRVQQNKYNFVFFGDWYVMVINKKKRVTNKYDLEVVSTVKRSCVQYCSYKQNFCCHCCQSVERSCSTQTDYTGSQCQTRRPGLDTR